MFSDEQQDIARQLAVALKVQRQRQLTLCINPYDPTSRPYEKQQAILDGIHEHTVRAVVAANQTGKTAVGGRECAWIFDRTHPTYELPDRPLKLIVIGRVGEQVESEIWRDKIKPFLDVSTYKEVRTGNALQRVEHLVNGNVIIFMSHHNVNEAREKAQSYVADWVWLDEMCASLSLITELLLRVQANMGRFLLTFTPLVKVPAIRKWIERLDPRIGRVYNMHMLDNPIYKGREEIILAQFKDLPDNERRARLYGDWFESEFLVYTLDEERNLRDPIDYHPSWRHLEVVDPAASGKAGFMLFAQEPSSRRWFVVRSEYIKGAAPTDLIEEIEKRTEGYNIVKRVSDPHEVWFIKEAAKKRRIYQGVVDKVGRKKELVTNSKNWLVKATGDIASWCVPFRDELQVAQWSETVPDKIVNGHSYHLIDCFQYGVDSIPKDDEPAEQRSPQQQLRAANKERIHKERLRASVIPGQRIIKRIWASGGRVFRR